MTVSVFVEQTNGQFCASVAGLPHLCCVRPSRTEAIAALQDQLAQKVAAGELVNIELPRLGVAGLAGVLKDDPTLPELIDEIYRERDADPNR